MELRVKWGIGGGYITVRYDGDKDGVITIESDPNDFWRVRTQQIVVTSSYTSLLRKIITIHQLGSTYIDGGVFTKEPEYTNSLDGGTATTGEEYEDIIDCSGAEE